MKEKRLRLGHFELAFATDAANADRIRKSLPYRMLIAPAMGLLYGHAHGPAPVASPSAVRRPGRDEDPEVASILEHVSKIGWYHTIDLGRGIVTAGMVDARGIVGKCLPSDLSGKRVLDVGTCDGFWAFEMERRGAAEVMALDLDSLADYDVPRAKRQQIVEGGRETWSGVGLNPVGEGFRFARKVLGSKVKREVVNVYELSPEKVGTFDIVFLGYLLVHLRDPQTALENIFSVAKDCAIIVEPIDPDLEEFCRPLSSFVGTSYLGMWWEHNSHALRTMMQTAGFEPVEEIFRTELAFQLGPSQRKSMKTVALKGHVAPLG